MNKVGILYICTGKYDILWKNFYLSSEQYLLRTSEIHYFVFTDADTIFDEDHNPRIHKIYQKSLGWPDNTLKRFHMFQRIESSLRNMDFLYFFNANIVFTTPITDVEFLPQSSMSLVGVIHPGFYNKKRKQFTYETNPLSSAYIAPHEGEHYFQGALQGGSSEAFLLAIRSMVDSINQDEANKIVAVWHDESHWNRYLVGRTDIHVLDPGFIYPEDWKIPFEERAIMLDKSKIFDADSLRGFSITQIKNKIFRFLRRFGLL